jgi:hypothetical protein
MIPNNGANVLRDSAQIADQIFDRFLFQVGLTFDRVVDVGDVSLVMLGIMDLHRARVDMRFQSIVRIG